MIEHVIALQIADRTLEAAERKAVQDRLVPFIDECETTLTRVHVTCATQAPTLEAFAACETQL